MLRAEKRPNSCPRNGFSAVRAEKRPKICPHISFSAVRAETAADNAAKRPAAARALKAKPRRAGAQRTGNAGTGTPFFRRHGPALSPAQRKTAAAEKKPRKEIAAARELKAKPRRAGAQRTGNAGTGTPFFRRHGPALSPARREMPRRGATGTGITRAARTARAHNNEAGPKGSASFMGRKWITARRGRCCHRRNRDRGRPGRRSPDPEGHPGRRSRDPEDHPEGRPGPAGRPGTSSRTPC